MHQQTLWQTLEEHCEETGFANWRIFLLIILLKFSYILLKQFTLRYSFQQYSKLFSTPQRRTWDIGQPNLKHHDQNLRQLIWLTDQIFIRLLSLHFNWVEAR